MFARLIFAVVRFRARHGLAEPVSDPASLMGPPRPNADPDAEGEPLPPPPEIAQAQASKLRARRTGVRGEAYAYWFLRSKGYVMVARNFMTPGVKGRDRHRWLRRPHARLRRGQNAFGQRRRVPSSPRRRRHGREAAQRLAHRSTFPPRPPRRFRQLPLRCGRHRNPRRCTTRDPPSQRRSRSERRLTHTAAACCFSSRTPECRKLARPSNPS
jgi:hypothetical protein